MLLGIFASSVFNDPVSDGNGTDIQGSRDNVVVPLGRTIAADGYTFTYTGQEVERRGPPGLPRSTSVDRQGDGSRRATWSTRTAATSGSSSPTCARASRRPLRGRLPVGHERRAGPGEEPSSLQRGEAAMLSTPDAAGGLPRHASSTTTWTWTSTPSGSSRRLGRPGGRGRLTVVNVATGETRTLRPVYVITTDASQQFVQNRATDWDFGVAFLGMVVDEGAIRLSFDGADVPAEEWLVVQAYEKPFISLLWLGTGILGIGFAVSFRRRLGEARR